MKIGKRFGAALIPLISAAGLLFFAPMVLAGPSGPGMGPGPGSGMGPGIAVEELDTDQDGRISADEMDAYIARESAEVDADKNGKVSIKEMRALEERRREAMYEKLYLSMDKDNNGVVSVEEYAQALKTRLEQKQCRPGGPGAPGGPNGQNPQ